MALRTITGYLASLGSIEENQNGARYYSYLRFNTESGSDGYCEGVMTLPVLDSLLRDRDAQTFFFAEVRFPRFFGSAKRHVLYAVRSQGRTTEAVEQSCRLVSQQKVEAFKLLFYGLFLLPLYGFGLLLWIWAARLLAVRVPATAMSQELRRSST
ncbi:hypothetical protein [Dyella sp. C11]|uniref:hypothetical protein n=1 Tax=Dyella sp. C11 TaxID=2126991 RepID=UPI000D65594C|nr:hypothetical protein [Dyella sp. C11]